MICKAGHERAASGGRVHRSPAPTLWLMPPFVMHRAWHELPARGGRVQRERQRAAGLGVPRAQRVGRRHLHDQVLGVWDHHLRGARLKSIIAVTSLAPPKPA